MSVFVPSNRRIALLVAGVLVLATGSLAAGQRQVLRGHIPARVHALASIGRLDPSTNLHLAIGLPVRDAVGLANLLQQQQDPSSPNYRQFLTPEQFAQRFGATEQDYEAVVAFAQSHGLRVTARHPNRLLLSVSGAARDIESAFHLSLRVYRHPTEKRTFHAPDMEPSIDLAVPILHVSGLDDFAIPHSNVHHPPADHTGKAKPLNGSGPGYSYIGNDFRAAYAPGTALTGAGQSVGLLQFDGYYAKDITNYINDAHISTSAILTNVAIGGGVSTPGDGNIEVCLDIEMVLAMAPGVSKIIVYEAPNSTAYWDDLLSRMANDNLAKQLSSSWGGGGPDAAAEQFFLQMAAQGQSFFNASGDSDAFTSAVPFPADSTNIVQVGGTTLSMSGSGGAYLSEKVWNPCTYDSQYNRYVGSGGGTSTYYSIPSYQLGIDMPARQGSATKRNIPDVALTAAGVYVRYGNGSYATGVGGTSCAAPLWAGFCALVNQQADINVVPPVGFLNPAFYAIGKGASYTSAFHDTTSGSNSCPFSPTKFFAATGYDLCTGWGTPNGTNLINLLVPFNALRITPQADVTFRGPFGGPFVPASSSLLLTNASVAAITWSAGTTSMWFTLSATSGTLPAGGTTNITIALATTATGLAVQAYAGSVSVTNQTDNTQQSQSVSLLVEDGLQITPLTGTTFIGPVGGVFNPPATSLFLTNAGAASVVWHAGVTSTWFALAPSSGTLVAGGTTNVAVNLTAAATSLVAQIYIGTAWFTNQLSATIQGRTFVLLVGQPVVLNGGFETGDLTSWSSSGYNGVVAQPSWANYIHSGSYGMVLGTSGGLGYLYQTLQTISNRPYLISFWLRNPMGASGTQNEFRVQWGASILYDKTNLTSSAWTNVQLVALATAPTTLLTFGGRHDPDYFALDDVSAMVLAMPAFGGLTANTNAATLTWSAATNMHYQAQYTTNLVPANWVNLGSAILGTNGFMTATDPAPISSQRFYRVILQP